MEIQYLGTAGWYFTASGGALLIDPYFTRVPLRRLAFGPLVPDAEMVRRYTPPADWILVSHSHFDHLLDVPVVAQITGAEVYASRQSCDLLRVLGVPPKQMRPIAAGNRLALGPFTVEVYEVPHRQMIGRIPAYGPLREGLAPPLRARDYRMRELFSFRVEAGGVRVLVASGVEREPPVPTDVLLVGADASRAQLARILSAVQPRLVLPNHWDDMFRPLSEPARPSLQMPQTLGLLRRVDLVAWSAHVREHAPAARVLVPERFRFYDIRAK